LSYESWTEQEVEIKTMYPDNLTENLLPFPGRSISKIMGKANLDEKSALFLVNPKVAGISKENDIGIATRYQKNCPGWNKGLKQKDYLTSYQ
jgi:hypothetical protein